MAGIRRGEITFLLVETATGEWADMPASASAFSDLDALYAEYKNIPANVGPRELKVWGRREFHVAVLPASASSSFSTKNSHEFFCTLSRDGSNLHP